MTSLLYGLIIFELFAASLVFCCHAGRPCWRKAWPAPALYLVTTVPVLLGAPAVYSQVLFYVVVFSVVCWAVGRTFSLSRVSALVVGTLGYCTQHLASDVSFAALAISVETDGGAFVFAAANTLVLLAIYLVVWALIGRGFKIDEAVVQKRSRWVAACVASVFFLIAFRLWFVEPQVGAAQKTLYVYDALVTVFLMLFLVTLSRVDALRADIATQEVIWQGKRDQYELARDNMDLINIKCHDIRKRVGSMGGDAALSRDSLEQIRDSIRVYDAQTKTGNEALDVVLTEKRLFCSQAGIELICMADGSGLAFMADDDVYFLFDNILDNAIEAVLNLAESERRSINLTVRREAGFVSIREDNFYDGELHFEGGLPRTTKGDRANHGFGMKSIRRCAEEYGGELRVRADGRVFSLTMLFPCG